MEGHAANRRRHLQFARAAGLIGREDFALFVERRVEQRRGIAQRTEVITVGVRDRLARHHAGERITLQAPQEQADVGNVVLAAPVVDVAHFGGARRALEGRADQIELIEIAQIGRDLIEQANVIHVLRRRENLKELDRARGPTGHIARQIFQHVRGAFAAAIRQRVGDVGALTESGRWRGIQAAHAEQIADVGHEPIDGRFDEPVVVQFIDVGFDGLQLFTDHRQQRAQRLTLIGIAQPIERGQQVVELILC